MSFPFPVNVRILYAPPAQIELAETRAASLDGRAWDRRLLLPIRADQRQHGA